MKSYLKQKEWFKYFIALVIAVLLFTSIFFPVFLISNRPIHAETLEEELARVKKQKENTLKEIENTKKAESEYSSQVRNVESNLIVALSELEELNAKLSSMKTEVDRLTIELVIMEKELSGIEKTLQEKTELLNSRVAAIYKNRSQDVLQLFFDSETFIDFFSKMKLMNFVVQQDFQILQDVQDTRNMTLGIKENILNLKDEERNQKKDLEGIVEGAEKKKRDIEDLYNEKNNLLRQTRATKEALIKMEQELSSKEKEITKKLEALRYGTAPGKLAFPTRGVITSGFGNRISPFSGVTRFHGGIDIGAPTGTPVIAASDGEVIQAEYMGGYGYSILLYHGGGFATFYAHLSGFATSAGQKVKQGQIIGYVGSTGYSTGPHLHFEVRVNGTQKKPNNYF